MQSLRIRLLMTALWAVLLGAGAASAGSPTRARLIGAWRLVSIDYRGPEGTLEDPFYHRGSTGLLVYDASGAMSVQIAAADRPALAVASSRSGPATEPPKPGQDARGAAFDSYYAYYGSWTFDATNSTVVHHVERALIPAEDGASYSQQVSLAEGRLVMTNRHREAGRCTGAAMSCSAGGRRGAGGQNL